METEQPAITLVIQILGKLKSYLLIHVLYSSPFTSLIILYWKSFFMNLYLFNFLHTKLTLGSVIESVMCKSAWWIQQYTTLQLILGLVGVCEGFLLLAGGSLVNSIL